VILSTLFARQHVIVDEIYGFLLAYGAGWIAEKKIKVGERIEKYLPARVVFTVVLATIVVVFIITGYLP